MKQKTKFELWRWLYFFLVWLITMAIGITIVELLAAPFIKWLFHDIPYALPTWNRAGRMALVVLFIGFFAGTLSWYYEKRSTGR